MNSVLEKIGSWFVPQTDDDIIQTENNTSGYSNSSAHDDDDREDRYTNRESQKAPSIFKKNSNVYSMNQKSELEVVVYAPATFKDPSINGIAESLMANNAVVINLEKTESFESRRILDFLSGVAFAVDGKIKAISTATYIITPANVKVSGEDLFNEFENSDVYF